MTIELATLDFGELAPGETVEREHCPNRPVRVAGSGTQLSVYTLRDAWRDFDLEVNTYEQRIAGLGPLDMIANAWPHLPDHNVGARFWTRFRLTRRTDGACKLPRVGVRLGITTPRLGE